MSITDSYDCTDGYNTAGKQSCTGRIRNNDADEAVIDSDYSKPDRNPRNDAASGRSQQARNSTLRIFRLFSQGVEK